MGATQVVFTLADAREWILAKVLPAPEPNFDLEQRDLGQAGRRRVSLGLSRGAESGTGLSFAPRPNSPGAAGRCA